MHLVCLVLCLLLLTACGDAAPPESPSIVGTWLSEPTISQLGRIVQTLELEADGSVAMAADFVDAQKAAEEDPDLADAGNVFRMESSGTYEARDGTLRLILTSRTGFGGMEPDADAPQEETMTYRFEGDVLVLEEPGGASYRLRRR